MAITSYATLKTAVADWLHRSNLAAGNVSEFVQFGENRIYRDLRIRCMETTINSTISSGTIAVPTRYKELKFAYIDGTPTGKLDRKDAEWIHHNYPTRSADGRPKFIARDGETFIFGPYPDSAYTVKGTAYCALSPLSDSNTTNWLIDNAPELLLLASLCEYADWTGGVSDRDAAKWEGRYTQIKDRLQRENDNEEFSGSPLYTTQR